MTWQRTWWSIKRGLFHQRRTTLKRKATLLWWRVRPYLVRFWAWLCSWKWGVIKHFIINWRHAHKPRFLLWVRAFDIAARQIDLLEFNLSDELEWETLEEWYASGISPDDAIFKNQTAYALGTKLGHYCIDGTGRHSGASIHVTSLRRLDVRGMEVPDQWNSMSEQIKTHQRLMGQNETVKSRRLANELEERERLRENPIERGMKVYVKKLARYGEITDIIVTEKEPRPMYKIILHEMPNSNSEVVYCRAIELYWEDDFAQENKG